MRGAQFVCKLLQDTQMRVVGSLHEAVEKHDHLVQLEGVLCHHIAQLLQTVLEEEQLSALWVSVQELVREVRQGLNHELEEVVGAGSPVVVAAALARHHRVDVLERLPKEHEQVW